MTNHDTEETPMTDHCPNCGQANPDTSEGYTFCCNKSVCDGHDYGDRFGTPTDNVRACCWAAADVKFAAEGREAPEGSSRI